MSDQAQKKEIDRKRSKKGLASIKKKQKTSRILQSRNCIVVPMLQCIFVASASWIMIG